MVSSHSFENGTWSCPFLGFHCYRNGIVRSKRISRIISHLKSLHLPTDECKVVLREAITYDHGLFISVAATLKEFGQWIYGNCTSLHALSRLCHHPGRLIKFIDKIDDMSEHIVGIPKPPPNGPEADLNDGLVMDAQLRDHVF